MTFRPNAVWSARYQHMGDSELAARPMAAQLDEADRALLMDKAVAWLSSVHRCPDARGEEEYRWSEYFGTGAEWW